MCATILLMVLAATAATGGANRRVGNTATGGLLCGTGNPVDIYFLLDCSSSVLIQDFDKQINFVVSFINRTHIAPNATRVGLGLFSDTFYQSLELGKFTDKNTLIRWVKQTPYLGGNTQTGKGLRGMRTVGFAPGVTRANATKVAVLVTDGKSQQLSDTVAEARITRDAGIWIFAIGVGRDVDSDELAAIASEPRGEFSFRVASFDNLSTFVQNLTISVCNLYMPQSDESVCGQKRNADVMFVFNAAGMANREVTHVRKFIQDMAGKFSMITGKVRAGIISTEGCLKGDIDLGQYIRPQDFVAAVESQTLPHLSPLLKKLRYYGFQSSKVGRRDALRKAVIFLDETMSSPQDALYEAMLLRSEGVVLHVIAVGSHYSEEQVKKIATSPAHVTKVSTYAALEDQTKQTDFIQAFCGDF